MENDSYSYKEEIPKEFHSDLTGLPFHKCSICETSLEDSIYIIEKAFKKYPNSQETFTMFECAVCTNCKTAMMDDISEESKKNIQKFITENIDLAVFSEENTVEATTNKCIITGENIEGLNEYQIVGFFYNGKMLQPPMLLGETGIEQYADILSDKTKGFMDDFLHTINDLPPSLAKLLEKDKKIVFI